MSVHVLADGTKCYRWPTCRIHGDNLIQQLPADSPLRPQFLNLEDGLVRAYCEHALADVPDMSAAKAYALLPGASLSPMCPIHGVHHVYSHEAVSRATSNASSYLRDEILRDMPGEDGDALRDYLKGVRKETSSTLEQDHRALVGLKETMGEAELDIARANRLLQRRGEAFVLKALPASRSQQMEATPEELRVFYVCGRKVGYDDEQSAQANADRVWVEQRITLNPYRCEHCGKFHVGKLVVPGSGSDRKAGTHVQNHVKSWATNRPKAEAWLKTYRASRAAASAS
jgi:hypothetical protein